MGKIASKKSPWDAGANYASITVGTEAANVIIVSVTLKDGRRKALASGRRMVKAYLSDAATGAGITGTTVTGATAIGTNGTIIETTTTKKAWWIQTDTSGRFDISITNSGTEGMYLVVCHPDGTQTISSIIQFT